MELKLFTDLISALGKVAEVHRQPAQSGAGDDAPTLDETYRLVDTTLNMVIIRLGDNLLLTCCSLTTTAFCAKLPRWITTTNGCRRSVNSGCVAEYAAGRNRP